jgi:energy-coupling factor transporter transmembrane protein EcfT
MSDDVYKAMLSRGFHGEFRSINRLKSGPMDLLWLFSVLAGGCALLAFDRGFVW